VHGADVGGRVERRAVDHLGVSDFQVDVLHGRLSVRAENVGVDEVAHGEVGVSHQCLRVRAARVGLQAGGAGSHGRKFAHERAASDVRGEAQRHVALVGVEDVHWCKGFNGCTDVAVGDGAGPRSHVLISLNGVILYYGSCTTLHVSQSSRRMHISNA